MKERMKKIFIVNLTICLCLFHIANVFSYDYVDEKNKHSVESKREEIYQLKDLYKFLIDEDSSSYNLFNAAGLCNMITVEGVGTFSLEDYVAGVVSAESGGYPMEELKAQAIAARTFVLRQTKDSGKCSIISSTAKQVYETPESDTAIQAAQETAGMVIMRDGELAPVQYSSYSPEYSVVNGKGRFHMYKYGDDQYSSDPEKSEGWYWEGPTLDEIRDVYHLYVGGSGHTNGMSQVLAAYLAKVEGYTYEQIIELFYGDPIVVLAEGSYFGDLEFVDSPNGQITYWNQKDWTGPGNYFSSDVNRPQYHGTNSNGVRYDATISSHGCGPTSLAIVVSTLTGNPVPPQTTTEQVCQAGGCSDGGSSIGYLALIARSYGLETEYVDKSQAGLEKMANALASGNALVIALMGKGVFTNGGHYIVLTGTRSDGYISVADPNSRELTNTQWFSRDLIVNQASANANFLIVTRQGA